MTDLTPLRSAFADRRATLVVGTGLSISCSENAPTASWIGLLQQSILWVEDHIPDVTKTWSNLVRANLQAALDDSDMSLLLSAAGIVASKVRGHGSQAEANWLKDLIGTLEPRDPAWPAALDSLQCPILTTNYDTLIEQATGKASADWTDPTELHRVISSQSTAVGHLHGVWTKNSSVVLNEADYQRALSSAPLQALQQAASSVRSLVYIGVGDGLNDPNFSRLLAWHRETFSTSAVNHFRLCRESELADLTRIHGADNIIPISYGGEWSDLPAFIEQFRPSAELIGPIEHPAELGRGLLLDRVRELTILCENAENIDERDIGQLITPPVLSSFSSEQARAAQSSEVGANTKIERSDPLDIASRSGVIVIAGQDGSGRTTALYWLLEEAAKLSPSAMPLLISSKDLRKGGRPLINALRERAREAGLTLPRGASLPELIIGLDDLSPYNSKILDQTMRDLEELRPKSVFITCGEGFAADILKVLSDYGLVAEVQYIQELDRSGIRELLRLASPSRPRTIEDNVVNVLKQHHLPRTPFTVCLLISIMIGGKIVPANSSQTTLLDLYLDQLIGRGDFAEDSRWGMDSDLRAAVLTDLALFLVTSRSASMAEGAVMTRVSEFFTSRGIPESAGDLIGELRVRKVLRYAQGRISFFHKSYLFLFAAKAATKDLTFRTMLLEEPLFYAPILKHYPSLERADKDFLVALEGFYDRLDASIPLSSALHARVTQVDAPEDLEKTLLELERRDDSEADLPEGSLSNETGSADDLAMFPRSDEDVDVLVESPEGFPDFQRFAVGLDLISTALRDSVLVADPELKARLLETVLIGWGKLGSVYVEDLEAVAAVERALIATVSGIGLAEADKSELVTMLSELAPVILISSGIASSLSTTRLVAALGTALERPALAGSLDGALGASLLLLDVQPSGWVGQLERVVSQHKDVRVIAGPLKLLCLAAYVGLPGGSAEHSRLLRLISELETRTIRFKNDRLRQAFRSAFEQRLAGMKSRGQIGPRRSLVSGEME